MSGLEFGRVCAKKGDQTRLNGLYLAFQGRNAAHKAVNVVGAETTFER